MGCHSGVFARIHARKNVRQRDYREVGRGFFEGYVAVNAVGHSKGVVTEWSEEVISTVDAWTGQLSTEMARRQYRDSLSLSLLPCEYHEVEGPMEGAGWSGIYFPKVPITDRERFQCGLNDTGGRYPDPEDFWMSISEAALIEMGRSTMGHSMLSHLDIFLYYQTIPH